MWVKFKAPFDWKPKRSVTLAYRAGDIVSVTKACGEAAIALCAADLYRKTSRDTDPAPVQVVTDE